MTSATIQSEFTDIVIIYKNYYDGLRNHIDLVNSSEYSNNNRNNSSPLDSENGVFSCFVGGLRRQGMPPLGGVKVQRITTVKKLSTERNLLRVLLTTVNLKSCATPLNVL